MIRQLAQCPYCSKCEIALDDRPEVVFNPGGGPPGPCPHLVWLDGRYSQFEMSAHGTNRLIGSTEFRWDHPQFPLIDDRNPLTDYLRELVNRGASWEFAPAEPFAIRPISADEKVRDPKGREHPAWDVDGAAVFAQGAGAFVARLPDYQERQLASLRVDPGAGKE